MQQFKVLARVREHLGPKFLETRLVKRIAVHLHICLPPRLHRARLIGIFGLVALSGTVQAITIDNFIEGFGALTATSGSPNQVDTDNGLTIFNTIGGTRFTRIVRNASSAFDTPIHANWNPPAGMMAFSSDAGAFGTLELRYGGNGGFDIGAVDLNQDGSAMFEVVFPGADLVGSTLTITVQEGAALSSATLTISPGPQTLIFLYSSFSDPGLVTGNDVDTLTFLLTGVPSGDYTIDTIRTAVPEPATFAVMALGVGVLARRRRKLGGGRQM